MDAPQILLVDDDTALLEALPHMIALRIHGVRVDTSDSAPGALERIQDHDYDAIVSDIKMPGMDGLELLAKLQVLQPEVPALLITGHADQQLIIQALRNGAYDFIQKPIDRVYFVAALHRAIQTRQLRRQVQEQQRALQLHTQTLEQMVEQRSRELLVAEGTKDALIRDLLNCSLIKTSEFVLHPNCCDLIELCQHVREAYTAGVGLGLSLECDQEPIEAIVDRERISQVLIHLLSNAHNFSPVGSPITILLHREGDEVIISVQDTGRGIAEELLPHIFEQFYRVPEEQMQMSTRPSVGLGLYLSRYIVEQHGGRIEVQSSPGKGSTFSVVLPLASGPIVESTNELKPAGREPSPFQPPQWLVS